jgi:hypothetical protein
MGKQLAMFTAIPTTASLLALAGKRGQLMNGVFGNAVTMTYAGKGGCKYRVGLAVKLPPADGQASATSGIGQMKLKLEVYFV